MIMLNSDEDFATAEKIIPDFPPGPLDLYRKKASFNWKKMRFFLDGEEIIRFKERSWNKMENDPVFAHTTWEELSRSDERRLTLIRLRRLIEENYVNEEDYFGNPYLMPAFINVIGSYSWSLLVKRVLSHEYFIVNSRTDNLEKSNDLLNDIKSFKALGAISITEIAHGSNTKNLKTTATFKPETQEFILNTPNLEATKVWSGVLGQSATHAIVFAQLYTPDGKCHGLHSFIIKVRDPKTLIPYEGIVIGDMGPKLGLNGVDNGFMSFKNYAVPKSCLMGKSGNISPNGEYKQKVKSQAEKSGATLGILSAGRVLINYMSITNLHLATIIAVRYSAVRKQFGPKSEENGLEWPIIEYQSQQWRLIPYIAASYVLNNNFFALYRDFIDFLVTSFTSNSAAMSAELHALSSCAKAICGWVARDAIQEARESCGGHGYLKAARLGEIRDDHDANNTYEGDNHVLLQQTSNYLIKLYKEKIENGKKIESPFGTVDYIDQIDNILNEKLIIKSNADLDNISTIIKAYEFLVCYLLKESDKKINLLLNKYNGDLFRARNETQIYLQKNLAIAYFECNAIQRYQNFLNENSIDNDLGNVFEQLGLLYGYWSLEKHLITLYEANYLTFNDKASIKIREKIISLCASLKNESVALVDAIAPPDFILNSCLGMSDGRIYENIYDALTHSQGAFERPSWYTEFTESKLSFVNENIEDNLSQFKAKL